MHVISDDEDVFTDPDADDWLSQPDSAEQPAGRVARPPPTSAVRSTLAQAAQRRRVLSALACRRWDTAENPNQDRPMTPPRDAAGRSSTTPSSRRRWSYTTTWRACDRRYAAAVRAAWAADPSLADAAAQALREQWAEREARAQAQRERLRALAPARLPWTTCSAPSVQRRLQRRINEHRWPTASRTYPPEWALAAEADDVRLGLWWKRWLRRRTCPPAGRRPGACADSLQEEKEEQEEQEEVRIIANLAQASLWLKQFARGRKSARLSQGSRAPLQSRGTPSTQTSGVAVSLQLGPLEAHFGFRGSQNAIRDEKPVPWKGPRAPGASDSRNKYFASCDPHQEVSVH